MRIDWRQELEGYSLLQIRDVLRKLPFTNSDFTAGFFCRHLPGASQLTAKRVVLGLIESGLVTFSEAPPRPSATRFELTNTGISLRAAHATKRFKRARAEQAVTKLLGMVEQINADPIYLHDIESVAVFGSFITEEPDLGDIDVGVKLRARWKPYPGFLGKEKTDRERRIEIFEQKFPPPVSFYKKGFWRSWPETYTRRLLRTDPGIKIIERQELETIGCPYRQIYPETVDFPAQPDWSFCRNEIILKHA